MSDEFPVLVAGGGPAGLVNAITLAHQGVGCLLVEKRVRSSLPRATVVSTRSMELFRSFGLEDAVRAEAVDVRWEHLTTTTLARAEAGHVSSVGVPSPEQSAVLSPTTTVCVPQDRLEPLLLAHLRSLPGAQVELGTEVVAAAADADSVRVTLRRVEDRTARVVQARYVVAADGSRSVVRAAMGIPMVGVYDILNSITVLFNAPLWDVVGEHRYGIYSVTGTARQCNLLPAGLDDRWLFAVEWDPGLETVADYTTERVTEMLRRATGVDDLEPQIERIGAFSWAADLATRFREGRTFLVGDAAHRVTPRGGTGMNIAIHDGHDLGWRLAWVVRGWGRDSLLDAYESERRPVAEHGIARSIDPDGTRRSPEDEAHADLGGRIRHLWLSGATGKRSTLDVLGPGLTLFAGPGPDGWDSALDTAELVAVDAAERVAVDLRRVDAMAARALGLSPGGALLVRPDGTPVVSWPTAPIDRVAALALAVDHAAAGGPPAVEHERLPTENEPARSRMAGRRNKEN